MTLQEAIKRPSRIDHADGWDLDDDDLNALKLLIWAGEEIQALRRITVFGDWELLPGETRE